MDRRLTLVVAAALISGWLSTAAGGMGSLALSPATSAKLTATLRQAFARGDERLTIIVSLHGAEQLPTDPARRMAVVRSQVATAIASARSGQADDAVVPGRSFQLNPAFSATVSRAGLLALAQRDEVRAIEADETLPLHTAEGMAVIHADLLQNYGITGDDTAVAIIDTGIDSRHPALGGGAIPNAKVVRGVDFADNDDDPNDCSGHGTAVAAIAAGASYQWSPHRRFAGGVAPEAHILAYKAAPDHACTGLLQSALIAAIEDAVIHRTGPGYRLAAINISAGSGRFTGTCDAVAPSLAAAVGVAVANGITVVASAGNDGTDGELPLPACLSEVVSVGSVWDTTPAGAVGFCLDPSCERVCSDQGDDALTVACYSNSSPMLDLLAPSELLTTAERGGQVVDFGGTSGAAPYVAGAIALLADALPALDSTSLRLLLAVTGQPVVNPRTGVMTPLLDLEQALDLDGVAIGASRNVLLARPGTSPFVDTAWVDADGLVGALRVIVRLVHPDLSQLRLSLVSPAGTVVSLHDPSIPTHGGSPGDPVLPAGIFGVYPDTLSPAGDLGDLANQPLRGAWTLVVDSDGPVGSAAVEPMLIGWALAFEAKVAPQATAATSLFVPVVARTAGSLATSWSSDLRLLNPAGSATATVRLYLVPSGADGLTTFEQRDLLLPPATLLALDDVIASRFGQEQATGQLIIQSASGSLVASSRSATAASSGGSFGQLVGAVAERDGFRLGDPQRYLLHVSDNASYRTNLGLAEMDGAVTEVEIVVRDGRDGRRLGEPLLQAVAPFSHVQLNRLVERVGAGPCDNAFVTLRVVAGSGRVTAYASVVDNRSGDAIFLLAQPAVAAAAWVVPVVARTPGEAGTSWVSDLRVGNLGASVATIRADYTPARGTAGSPRQATLTVDAGQVAAADDVLWSLFGEPSGSGTITLRPPQDLPLVVTSRTYNRAVAGTYGQSVPAVTAGSTSRATLITLERSSSQRVNAGFREVAGGTAELQYWIVAPNGERLGEPAYLTLGPGELVQVNDVFAALGAPAAAAARLDISYRGGTGSYLAYASVIDETTGDAVFELATPVHSAQ